MFSFSTSKLIKNRSVILDVQSGLVRGAMVLFRHNEPAIVSAVITKSLPVIPNSEGESRMTKDMLTIISDVLGQIVKTTGHARIDTIHYVLSSPWIFSESKSVKINYGKEVKITQATIDSIIKEQMNKNILSEDIQHVEIKVAEVRLNGYQMEDFNGKNANTLEVFFYNSFGSKSFFDQLTVLVQKTIHIRNHEYHSALLLQYSALRMINSQEQDYIYVHVHSELTDVVVVKNGICKQTTSFSFGVSTMLRKISEATGQSPEASDSLLTLYQGDKLELGEKDKTKKIIDPLMAYWSESCIKSISDTLGVFYVPRTVFLSVHSHYEVFKNALLFNNDMNFDITSYDNVSTKGLVEFGQSSAQSTLIKLYTLVLSNMI